MSMVELSRAIRQIERLRSGLTDQDLNALERVVLEVRRDHRDLDRRAEVLAEAGLADQFMPGYTPLELVRDPRAQDPIYHKGSFVDRTEGVDYEAHSVTMIVPRGGHLRHALLRLSDPGTAIAFCGSSFQFNSGVELIHTDPTLSRSHFANRPSCHRCRRGVKKGWLTRWVPKRQPWMDDRDEMGEERFNLLCIPAEWRDGEPHYPEGVAERLIEIFDVLAGEGGGV